MAPFRWLFKNLGTLLLAFILAIIVWVSAENASDPIEQKTFQPVIIEIIGQNPNVLLTSDVQNQANLTLSAPRSIWTQLESNPARVRAWIDLSGLEAGEHTLPLHVKVDISPVRIVQTDPLMVSLTLETLMVRKLPVELTIDGDPPLGYKKGTPTLDPGEVTVSGPESQVSQVAQIRAVYNVTGIRETKKITLPVEALDQNGDIVSEVTLSPKYIAITQPIQLEGGYKNVVVKVVTRGQVANGYRLTNISVTPPNVTVFSANPQLVNEIPGYLETKPIDMTGVNDDLDIRVELVVPKDVSLVGEQSVLVQVGIAAIEGSLTISLPVEMLGLSPELTASISPSTLDVIVSGPLPVLDALSTASFRVLVDLSGLGAGVYQVTPVMDLAPNQVKIESILPATIEVTITPVPTPTPTVTPGMPLPGTPTATVQP